MQFSLQNSRQMSALQRTRGRQGYNRTLEAFESLRQAIVTGQLRPNQRLLESDLAKRLGMSRSPLREALRLLEAKGYISRLPSSGLIVTDHTPTQIQNLFDIREALESKAIKLACQRITKKQTKRLEENYMRTVDVIRNQDVDQFIELNNAFHEELYATCGNKQLWSLIQTFRDQYFDRRIVRVFTDEDWRMMMTQHGEILEAVRQRNANRAQEAISQHLQTDLRIASERL